MEGTGAPSSPEIFLSTQSSEFRWPWGSLLLIQGCQFLHVCGIIPGTGAAGGNGMWIIPALGSHWDHPGLVMELCPCQDLLLFHESFISLTAPAGVR